MRRRFFIIASVALLALALGALFDAPEIFAQSITAEETFGGTAPTDFASSAGLSTGSPVTIIAQIIRVILGFLGVVAVGFVLYGGFLYMSSKGEEKKIQTAKQVMINAFIGLAIVLSSYAIASFVISKLIGATGGSVEGEGSGGGGEEDEFDPIKNFVLQTVNTECAEALRNLELQLSFSQNVVASTATSEGIRVQTLEGEAVAGVYEVSGKRVSFTPSTTCTTADGTDVACFAANTSYKVIVNPSIVKSTSGSTLKCSDSYPCTYAFTTGEGIDIVEPTVNMAEPDDGDSVYAPELALLQAHTEDDTGVSSTDFYLDGELVDSSGLDESLAGVLSKDNYFYGEWDTAGYVTNKKYPLKAKGFDCAGNDDVSDTINAVLRAANCGNDTLDDASPYFEDDIDCGGDAGSEYYCGACVGSPCIEDAECASGECDEVTGSCVASVEIEEVSPTDGAPGNLITILGNGFGTTPGSVVFLGDPENSDDDVTLSGYAQCDQTWQDDQVVVQIKENTIDGPMRLSTADGLADRTDDENGPVISDFDVNAIVRPGLCELNPQSAQVGEGVDVFGNNFGEEPASSSFYFGVYESTSYPKWDEDGGEIGVVVPRVESGKYDAQLFVGDGELREGSNKLEFTVASEADADQPPVIARVDTGVKRCSDDGAICGDAGNCHEGASCAPDPDAGPIGQYLTIYGSNFGSTTGTVRFRNVSFDRIGLADTEFPDYCPQDFWREDTIVVKVPKEYSLSLDEQGNPYGTVSGLHDLWVVRGDDGLPSDPVDFEVIGGKVGPSICAIEPDNGPPGTEVTLFGEAFGSAKGKVTFHENQTVNPGDWSDTEIAGTTAEPLQVSNAAQTGPVFMTDADAFDSNSINFEVGFCDVDYACSAGQECCANGACQTEGTCEENLVPTHYAYFFSTGDLPDTPKVIVECSEDYISPSPWEFWEGGTAVCVNAVITASFTTSMDTTTFTASTIVVEQCLDATCSKTSPVAMTPATGPTNITPVMFSWDPADDLQKNTRYRITIIGGEKGVKSAKGAFMAEDASFAFVTANSDEYCTVGGVYLSPAEYTATAPYDAADTSTSVPYVSLPVASEYQCVTLSCAGYTWDFTSSNAALAGIYQPSTKDCKAYALPYAETSGSPVLITSELQEFSVDDTGELLINFTDPEIVDFWPNCNVACTNAGIGFTTNVNMNDAFTGFVNLYECEDSACAEDELRLVKQLKLSWNADTFTLSIDPAQDVKHDTSYRVVVSPDLTSTSGVPLSEWGGEEMAWNGQISWKFSTKQEACLLERVQIEPEEVLLKIVGDRAQFTVVPYSAPDACSSEGQRLNSADFSWEPWSAKDDPDLVETAQVAALLPDGSGDILVSPDLPLYCSSECLNTGSGSPVAVCGNDGDPEPGEDCDDGNTTSGDGCSAVCLTEGVTACTSTGALLCCGNGIPENREECDDGKNVNGDGCSATCLNEGATEIDVECGDGEVAGSPATGGEECDHKLQNSVYNCSSDCLNLGSPAAEDVYAVCGDGVVGFGEDCENSATKVDDGCSENCQHEGSADGAVCGDGTTEITKGEDCDDDNTQNGDGCSSICLFEGSDYRYAGSTWSICSDGTTGSGEECEATTLGYLTAAFGIAEVTSEAPLEVAKNQEQNDISGSSSTIVATETASGETGSATLGIQCACSSDFTCGDTTLYGCGEANCCFERPLILTETPQQNQTNVCRNAAVWVEFDQAMDESSFIRTTSVPDQVSGQPVSVTESTLFLELVGFADGTMITEANYLTLCPSTYKVQLTVNDADMNLFEKTWAWIARGVARLFNRAYAAEVSCQLPVSFEQEKTSVGSRVRLVYSEALQADGVYELVTLGDSADPGDDVVVGVASVNGAGLLKGSQVKFTVGNEICELEYIEVTDQGKTVSSSFEDPSPGTFREKGELHTLTAQSYTLHGSSPEEIQEIAGVYEWSLDWSSTQSDADTATNIVSVTEDAADETEGAGVAAGVEGEETAVVTATISDGGTVSGEEDLNALLCENPWPDPDLVTFPFADTAAAAKDFGLISPYTNFGFFYCRDLAQPMCVGGTNDGAACADDGECPGGACSALLPALEVVEAPVSPIAELQSEMLFLVDGTSDALGVRVFSNEDYLPADEWYKEQAFTGSPSATILDGYEGVQDGNTSYIAAANQSGSAIYPNIYVLSVNDDARAATQNIFTQVRDRWAFNANTDEVTDLGVCKVGSTYLTDSTGALIECSFNEECEDSAVATSSASEVYCDAEKGKLTRDMRRLTDVTRMQSALADYASVNRHCSVTTDESCSVDENCPGSEMCVDDVPVLAAGSFLRSFTTSTWPSWSAVLGNVLGVALPTDPLNVFVDCPVGADETFCWNSVEGEFICQEGSHAYLYRAIGIENYELWLQLEYPDAAWVYPIDHSPTDNTFAENSAPTSVSGFYSGAIMCSGTTLGESGLCGDGTLGGKEVCELGQTTTIDCADGTMTAACKNDCSGYQTESEAIAAGAVCVAYECGNGAVDPDEDCDDGTLNGTYGFCGESCDLSDAFYCGDGSLAGGEECDCGADGTTMNAGSWSSDNCTKPNGQYSTDYDSSCAFDCTFPGPSCGDSEVNSDEECDGGYESSAKVCGVEDNYASCATDADCEESACGDEVPNCPISFVCVGGDDAGEACSKDCSSGVCSTFEYQLTRYRSCDDDIGSSPSCEWNNWSSCLGGDQACGNGMVEGKEECDDGNDDSTDACTQLCTLNVCGDGYRYVGKETCDEGDKNGEGCEPGYEDSCNYCTNACQYTVVSGAYCGDETVNGNEYCDAPDVPTFCSYTAASDPNLRVITGVCNKNEDCVCDDEDEDCVDGLSCQSIGVCDGGSKYASSSLTYDYNGAPCTSNSYCGADSSTYGTTQGTCVMLDCSADCTTACPFAYDTSAVLIQTETVGASATVQADLYSYNSGNDPDTAAFIFPACAVGTSITADIDTENVTQADAAIIFVTDASNSMAWCVDGSDTCSGTDDQRIDYVRESLVGGIDELFDSYDAGEASMQIGLLRYSGDPKEDDGKIDENYPGYSVDSLLVDSTSQTQILGALDFYDEEQCYQWTPTFMGMEKAILMLNAVDVDVKAVVLLSDGDITHTDGAPQDPNKVLWKECDEPDCVSEIQNRLIDKHPEIQFFSASIVSDSSTSAIGYIRHLSSDDCGNDWSNPADCIPSNSIEYAYQASTSDEIEAMYDAIIQSIVGVNVSFVTEFAGETTITSGSVLPGDDVTLPFPTGFDCNETTEWVVPMRISFNGEGTVNISDINLKYCPAF